ncbi:MAG TPA: permease [Clostridiales bacterium UBA8960]|nr:permease [Clostridiales bacterium UBA8960]
MEEVKRQKLDRVMVMIMILFAVLFLGFNLMRLPNTGVFDTFKTRYLDDFTVILISILLEAMPFVLIGAFVSSLIQIFVSEAFIVKIMPKNRVLGLIAASLMGFVFPVCECAIVPIMRRLVKKGVPIHVAITFMLAVPIANPVVLLSTYYAFSGSFMFVFLRGFLGILGAITIGHFAGRLAGDVSPLKEEAVDVACGCGLEHDHNHEHDHVHVHGSNVQIISELLPINAKKSKFVLAKEKATQVIGHTAGEFYDVGKFLIIGAILSSVMQVFIPRNAVLAIGEGSLPSIIVMMTMAFVLSLCSEADAFIARTFMGQFTTGSIVGFLIFGPMIDIKNTIMLSSVVKPKFLIQLISVITVVCFTFAVLINIFGL